MLQRALHVLRAQRPPYFRSCQDAVVASRRSAFVPMAGKAFVVPYNASRPIVVDAPRPLELRWRLWKAESQERPANLF